MITKPDRENYSPQRCEWGFRNPRNHLKPARFATMLEQMCARGDQRITCPGCGRDVYLELKITGHNHGRPLSKKEQAEVIRRREENRRDYHDDDPDL